jgi:hypothetical protein
MDSISYCSKLLEFEKERSNLQTLREKALYEVSTVNIWLVKVLQRDLHYLYKNCMRRRASESKGAIEMAASLSIELNDILLDLKDYIRKNDKDGIDRTFKDAKSTLRWEKRYLHEAINKVEQVSWIDKNERLKDRMHALLLLN